MKTHLKYKVTLLAAIFAVIFAFTACSPENPDTSEDAMEKESKETMESATEKPMEKDTEKSMEEEEESTKEEMSGDKTFTLEELSQYDGTNGNPAYVAVDGVVYDVTDKPLWAGGKHKGNTAGMDLSEEITKSPHGKAKLETLPVVGTLKEEISEEMSEEITFTLEELSQYDGKNGNPAYIAVDGVVYDVTDNPNWSDGTHHGQTAGLDLTEFIKDAPHGDSPLEDLPVVGKLV